MIISKDSLDQSNKVCGLTLIQLSIRIPVYFLHASSSRLLFDANMEVAVSSSAINDLSFIVYRDVMKKNKALEVFPLQH